MMPVHAMLNRLEFITTVNKETLFCETVVHMTDIMVCWNEGCGKVSVHYEVCY